jgi:hypothetical protein
MPAEPLFFLIFGAEHESDADAPGHLDGLEYELLDELGTEAAPPLVPSVDPDPAEEDGRQLFGLIAREAPGRERYPPIPTGWCSTIWNCLHPQTARRGTEALPGRRCAISICTRSRAPHGPLARAS